jgi:hypothetical protein
MSESRQIDVLLPAAKQRSVKEAFIVSGALGLWSAAVVAYVLTMWSYGRGWFVKLLLLLLWPLLWFVSLAVFFCLLACLAQVIASSLRLPESKMKPLTSVVILLAFSGVAVWLLLELGVWPSFLSALWFTGCAVMLVRQFFSTRGEPTSATPNLPQ